MYKNRKLLNSSNIPVKEKKPKQPEPDKEQSEESEQEEKTDPEQVFLMACRDDDQAPLPILSAVHNRTLSLGNYKLSDGHCEALNKAA